MAEFVSTNQYLLVNSVDLSSVLLGTDMAEVIESQDITAMGASARIALPGLIGHSFRAEFNQNYAASGAGSVDATISALVSGRTTFAVAWRPVNTTIATTNPEYQFSAFVSSYTRASGRVGEAAKASVEFTFTTALTRDVTP